MRRLAYILAAAAFAAPLAAGSASAALVTPAHPVVAAGADAAPIDQVRYYRHRHWHHRRVYYHHHRHWHRY
jgi:hypothetical protein